MSPYIDLAQVRTIVLHDASGTTEKIDQHSKLLRRVQEPFLEQLQEFLHTLEGHSFGSLEENRKLVRKVNFWLAMLNAKIVCPREECSQLVRLECVASGRAKFGSFRFIHKVDERFRAHFTSVFLPRLKVQFIQEKEAN